MSTEVRRLAYSPILWVVTIVAISLVLILATYYLVKCIRTAKKFGVTNGQIKDAMKTSSIASIGPSIVIMISMISLLVMVGAPTAWMRLSVIGDITQELMAVGFATDAYGLTATASAITPEIFQIAVFLMAAACIGYIGVPAVFCTSFEKLLGKLGAKNGGNSKMMNMLASAAILGCYAYIDVPYLLAKDASTIAMLVGFVAMLILQYIQQKFQIKWLIAWGFLIAMFIGMGAGVLAA